MKHQRTLRKAFRYLDHENTYYGTLTRQQRERERERVIKHYMKRSGETTIISPLDSIPCETDALTQFLYFLQLQKYVLDVFLWLKQIPNLTRFLFTKLEEGCRVCSISHFKLAFFVTKPCLHIATLRSFPLYSW